MKAVTSTIKALSLTATFAAAAMFISAPAASAATIMYCLDGDGARCQLSDVTIDSASYNVTFSVTPDFTFESDPGDALTAIVSTLDSLCPYCYVGDNNSSDDAVPFDNGVDYIFVAGPDPQSFDFAYTYPSGPTAWGGLSACSACGNPYPTYANNSPYIYANFSAATSATPEPSNIAMMFGGVAILALWERKRKNRQNQSMAQAR